MDDLDKILNRLESCVRRGTYESLETDWLEVKPVPATGNAWDSIRESICAFLNTRGGVVLLGLKDEQKPHRHYTFTGYTEDQSGQLSELRKHFKDARRNLMDVGEFIRFEVRPFIDGQVALVRVSSLPEDRKFCLFRRKRLNALRTEMNGLSKPGYRNRKSERPRWRRFANSVQSKV